MADEQVVEEPKVIAISATWKGDHSTRTVVVLGVEGTRAFVRPTDGVINEEDYHGWTTDIKRLSNLTAIFSDFSRKPITEVIKNRDEQTTNSIEDSN